MYVFFEHHRDAEGSVLATDVVCSSFEHGIGIAWKREGNLFEIMNRLMKTPKLDVRSYNPETKIWTYLGTVGFQLLATLQDTFSKLSLKIEFREVSDLETQVRSGGISVKSQTKIDPKEFFYNKAPITQEITKEMAEKKLKLILGDTLNKSTYRAAALRLHPDRNGGSVESAKQMSELNMYWSVWNA